jgi:hypothetical protein
MKRLAQLVSVGLLALLGAASCSSPTVGLPYQASGESLAEVTGFASVQLPFPASGPVTVRVAGTEASGLAVLVSQLPSIKQSLLCHEQVLMYRIVFGPSAAQSDAVVEGYACDAVVTVTVAGNPTVTVWGRDADCTLIRAVAHVLPARAKLTRSLDVGCGR